MVGGGQQLVKVAAGGSEHGHPDRDRHPAGRATGDRGGDTGYLLPQPLRDLAGLRGVGAGQQDAELLAAEPAGEIRLAQQGIQGAGQGGQHGVPGQVPERVVDVLEVVDVGDRHRERGPGPGRPGGLQPGFPQPGTGVEQAGLGVDAGRVDQLGVPEGTVQQRD